jgi:hypothetical protein
MVLVALPWHLWYGFRKQVKESSSCKRFKGLHSRLHPNGSDNTDTSLWAPMARSLRLVMPLAGLPDQHGVGCHISHYALDQFPPYEALSYCCGSIGDRRAIWCSGAHFGVSANLWSAYSICDLITRVGFSRLPLCRHGGATGFLLESPRSLALPAR